ncbi:hypothetical protein [Natrialba sp. SSL1]|uniref:hypothetical protein n=1 Tax=Natrialba sp. SSL1 TaxID=1869245 RepID=UPI0008F900BA|nr:hypothetical protein [Natrialba sp. SSL1]OIB55468.1 hypothetical protein BBD46_03955 [Natrialba sp. SSL1]
MALADRLEELGVVVGCAILLAIPTAALLGIFVDAVLLPVQLSLLALVPGILVGLVVLRSDRLEYTHVWRFGLTTWLAAFVLWGVFDISQDDTDIVIALSAWLGAVAAGLVAATADRWRS